MDFLYRNADAAEPNDLHQGDIIQKTDDVRAVLRQAHAYYAEAAHYSHFMVLTQSCDLVMRGGKFKAPYVTIAAIKSFSLLSKEKLASLGKSISGSTLKYYNKLALEKFRHSLERHLNNTEDDYFLLPQSDEHNITQDLVAFLRLSVALRPDHYQVLRSARISGLTEVYQAKLGWLTSNIYGRVATPDIVESLLDGEQRKQDFLSRHRAQQQVADIGDLQAAMLRQRVSAELKATGADVLDDKRTLELLAEIPPEESLVAAEIAQSLINKKLIGDAEKSDIARAIARHPHVKRLIKAR